MLATIVNILIELIAGALGGNAARAIAKNIVSGRAATRSPARSAASRAVRS